MSNKTQEILDIYKAKVMSTYAPTVVLASGKGITVRDVDGLSYYDFTSGIGVQAVGYSNKKVVEAIRSQASVLTHCSNLYVNEPSTRLADKLVELYLLRHLLFFLRHYLGAGRSLVALFLIRGFFRENLCRFCIVKLLACPFGFVYILVKKYL